MVVVRSGGGNSKRQHSGPPALTFQQPGPLRFRTIENHESNCDSRCFVFEPPRGRSNFCSQRRCAKTGAAHAAAAGPRPSLLNPASLKAKAPAVFKAKFTTSAGDFVVEVHRAWRPMEPTVSTTWCDTAISRTRPSFELFPDSLSSLDSAPIRP